MVVQIHIVELACVDGFDNVVPVDFENTSVKCNAGSATHVNGGTWEIEIDESGNDRYCTILWEGLLAQQFYDVEEVLLGGAVGSTNTAIGMLSFLLGLIFWTWNRHFRNQRVDNSPESYGNQIRWNRNMV